MFWIEGWIEAATCLGEDDAFVWSGVVDLATLVQVGDNDSERLFGLSKNSVGREQPVSVLAAGRGVPPDQSEAVRRALAEIREHEARYGAGEFGGYTHALWSEILALPSDTLGGEEWILPFALAEQLAGKFGPERVRFVVWYNW